MSDATLGLSRSALLAVGLLMAAGSSAHAAGNLLLAEPAAAPVVEKAASQTPAEKAVARSDAALIPFEDASDDFELNGELDVALLTVSAGTADSGRPAKLVLAFKNAVSVLPDNGRLRVDFNGVEIGELPIASPFDAVAREIAIPQGLVRPGRNQVKIRAIQHHRVDCSLPATYELWTRIDPARSGLSVSQPTGFSTIEDLVRVGRLEGGQTDVRLVLPATASADHINQALPLVQAVTLYLNRQDILVSVAQQPGTGPGIDLFVGTDDLAGQTDSGVKVLSEASYGLSVSDDHAGRARVILKASGEAELTGSLLAAVRGPMTEGLKTGLKAARFGELDIEAGEVYTLRQTGFRSTTFAGRLFRQKFDLVMPADFYPGDYATMDLKLNAATAAGLLPSAQLLVRVNDRVVNSFPFRNTDGETFTAKKIELPLRAFRPGINHVELIGELPVAADATCVPEGRKDDTPRFIMLDTTEIHVPQLARITRLPDLAAFAGKAWPYAGGKPFAVHVADPDSQSVSAALTLVTRLAIAAKSPLKARLAFGGVPESGDDPAILLTTRAAIAAAANAPEKIASTFAVDPVAVLPVDLDGLATAGILAAPAPAAEETADADALLESFRETSLANPDEAGLSSRIRDWLSLASSRFSKWLNYETDKPQARPEEGKSLVTIVQGEKPAGNGLITVVSADDSRTLNVGVARLTNPAVWSRLDGGTAIIDRADLALMTWPAQGHAMTSLTDLSAGNLRRVAAAWFSDNFRVYVLSLIGLAALFAFWLGRLVPKLGVRTDA